MIPAQRLLFLLLLFLLLALASPALAQDYTGWWWIPSESGTGYSLEVQELSDKDYDLAYLVWYLYDETGANTWLSSIMQVWGDDMNGDLVQYEGWPLEQGLPDEIVPTPIGQISFHFKDENTATLFYTVQGLTGTKTIQRWTKFGNDDPRALTGWWWDESKPGLGWFLEAKYRRCYLGWFNYREPLARTGGEPRWFSALSKPFEYGQTPFSEPLYEYSDGQTYDGEYQQPSYVEVNPEKNFEFSLPKDSTPESLDIEYQGQAYHLTRFTIPDAFPPDYAGCAPVPVYLSPAPDCQPDVLKPLIRARIQTPCGSAIDDGSIVMKLNGQVVPHVDYDEAPNVADLRYQTQEALPEEIPCAVSVSALDEYGYPIVFHWSFTPSPSVETGR